MMLQAQAKPLMCIILSNNWIYANFTGEETEAGGRSRRQSQRTWSSSPPTNTTKINVRVEQFSQKTNWKQAEGGEVTCLASQCIWLRCCYGTLLLTIATLHRSSLLCPWAWGFIPDSSPLFLVMCQELHWGRDYILFISFNPPHNPVRWVPLLPFYPQRQEFK